MAATAAAVATSFSTSMQSLKSIAPKTWLNDHTVKVPSARTLQPASISQSIGIELNPITGGVCNPITGGWCNKWRIPCLAEAVAAQEEEEEAAALVEASDGVGAAENSGVNTKLYFGNLPYNCDSAQLAGIVQEYASPELVEVLYDMNTGRSRGFAFVTMSSVEECNAVIQNLDGREYGGRTLRVNFSDKPKPKEPLYPETDHKLFVGNLSWSITSESLKEAFEIYGKVVGARVLYDGETGKSRGYGFVSYETRAEMDAALEALNGEELDGRAMRISLAQGKK